MGKKVATNIPGVFAPADGPERYRVVRAKFRNGTAIIPFVYLATDDLDEAIAEARQHPHTDTLDTHTGQTVTLPETSRNDRC
ncbi:MAG: hypothetical protein JO250_22815 [Armatimonadetes bacterium]|nr:hypothetical protein [Armatimonadota bacterium]